MNKACNQATNKQTMMCSYNMFFDPVEELDSDINAQTVLYVHVLHRKA